MSTFSSQAGCRVILSYRIPFKFFPYVIATLAMIFCALLRWMLDGYLHSQPTLISLLPAIVLGAYLGGIGVGIYATILGMVIALQFFITPADQFLPDSTNGLLELLLYLLVASMITALCGLLRTALQQARQEQAQRTARVAAEQLAEQFQARLGTVLRSAAVSVYTCDLDLRYTWVGKPIPPFDAQQMMGKRDDELFDTTFAAPLMELKQAAINQVSAQRGEIRHRHDGQMQSFEFTVEPLLDDRAGARGCIVVAVDVSERVYAQMEIEQRLHHLADTLPHMVWIARPNGFREFFNRRWYDYIGPSSSDDQWADALHPEDQQRARRRWENALRTGEPYEIEYRFQRVDGSYRWFLGRALPLRDDEGAIIKWFGTCTDIDDAKRAQASMALLQAAVESANDGVIITEALLDDPGPRIEYVNPAFTKMTGYEVHEVLGKTPRILQGPNTDRDLLARLRRDLMNLQTFHGQTINYRKDGTEYTVEWRITALKNDRDEVTHWVAVQRDVSERVRAERALQISEGRYRALVQAAAQVVWVGDAECRSAVAGGWMEEFTGLTRDPSHPLQWWQEAIHPEDRTKTLETFAQAVRNVEPFDVEMRLRHRDSTYRHVSIRGVPMRIEDGSLNEWVGTISDISERRLAEQAARDVEKRFRKAIVDAPIPILLYADDGEILTISRAFSTATGYSPDDLPTIDRWLELAARKAPADNKRLRTLLFSGVEMGEEEHQVFTHDGEMRVWRISTSTPGRLPDGRRYVVAMANDLTERRRIEKQREVILESERTARLEQERIGRMKDEFLATLSHELRTPLHAILGWAQILTRDTGKRSEEDLKKALETIQRNARVQAQLIDDLLDMSRIISGKISLNAQPLRLDEVMHTAVESVRPAAEGKQIDLVELLSSDAGSINGDAARLQQIFWNLLSNAIKFTPRGGRVEVLLEKVESHLIARVCDSGQGIAPEFLPFVFDRFRQADSSISRRHGGLGLGLAISKQLVEMHGGTIRVDSDGAGKGSQFTVQLPITNISSAMSASTGGTSTDVSEMKARADQVRCQSLAGVKVLVVDDETDARLLLKRWLDDCEAVVITADSASAALEILQRAQVDVIVSDIGMPGANGYAFIQQVRELSAEQGGRTPAVALTALVRGEDRQRALRSGFQVHISKPADPNELIAAVASLAGLA